jgi:NAD(P)-dependent dehydrogenase (short-subunit alcohol dehydrogenase family)
MFSLDLTNYEKVQDAVDMIVDQTGKIDGLINCAGISATLPFTQGKPEKMDKFFQNNVYSAMNLTRLAVKQSNISEEGASIIFISSVMGVAGENGKSLYSMTKGALIAGVRSLAIEMAPRNIRVNCVSPGVVETPMTKKAAYSQDEEALKKIISYHPLGLGQPEDVANACIYLLSDASKWVTGTNLIVDGGYLAR